MKGSEFTRSTFRARGTRQTESTQNPWNKSGYFGEKKRKTICS